MYYEVYALLLAIVKCHYFLDLRMTAKGVQLVKHYLKVSSK